MNGFFVRGVFEDDDFEAHDYIDSFHNRCSFSEVCIVS